eukprot:3227840-Rhodomonas_salina.2
MAKGSKVTPMQEVTSASESFKSFCNDAEQNAQMRRAGNLVTTAKYNIATFLPKNLFEQFSRLAN